MTARIAIVDDDPPMRAFVRRNLEARTYEVLESSNGLEALALLRHERVDLVILDIMMPHLDGYETCRRLREFSDVPVIVLTAMGDERDVVTALDCGADDYLTKPFGVEELLARIRSVLRRATREIDVEPNDEIVHRDLRVDVSANRAWLAGEQLDLTRTEFTVLRYYAENLGRTVPHKQVLNAVWGEGYESESHYVRIYVSRLRAKIEGESSLGGTDNDSGTGCDSKNSSESPEPYFATEHGLGYRLG